MLSSLLETHGRSLNDECLITLITEVECILKSRPLTVHNKDAEHLLNNLRNFSEIFRKNVTYDNIQIHLKAENCGYFTFTKEVKAFATLVCQF